MAMGFGWKLIIPCCFLWLILTLSVVYGATGPSDVTVQQGATATLTCSLGTPLSGFAAWSEDGVGTFADINGIFPGADAKYNNFALVKDDTANGQYDLRVDNAQYEDGGAYRCQFGGTPLPAATLTVEVPATSLTIAIDGVDQSSSATVTEDIAVTLTCTALGAKPQVSIDWFKGSSPLTPDTETVPPGGAATDTLSTYSPFIPTRSDDGGSIECRTGGHQTTQSEFITLNVRFAPVVTSLTYRDGIITCNADANPITNIEYYIILNGTKPSAPTGKTLAFNVDENYCTEVSCNVTNAVGTGSRKLEEPLCPWMLTTTGLILTTDTTEPSRKPASPGVIVGPVVAATLIVAVAVAFAIVLWRRHHKQKRTQGQTKTEGQDDGNYVAPDRHYNDISPLPSTNQATTRSDQHHQNDIPLDQIATASVYESIANEDIVQPEASNDMTYGNVGPDLSFSRDLVVIENELGRGQFGRVLLGKALGIPETGKETKVAVKTLKEGADRQARMELLAELELMKTVGSHPNVVKLLGYCAEKDPVYVIVEYLAKGDLKHVLLEYRDKDPGTGYSNLPGLSKSLSRTLVKFARDVANGMAFISSQKCVHRDLAARNVLVGDDMVCKVSDFGLARDVMNIRIYQRESQGPLPMRWMALESLLDDVYTTESDVWSFGILLWEIVTLGARPYPMMKTKTMVSQLQQGYRMPKPQHCKKQLYEMMCSCWQESPKDRPSFQSLYQQLDDMLSEEKDFITIHQLDESIYEVTVIEDTNEKL